MDSLSNKQTTSNSGSSGEEALQDLDQVQAFIRSGADENRLNTKRANVQSYSFVRAFSCLAEAEEFIRANYTHWHRTTTPSANYVKKFYSCLLARECVHKVAIVMPRAEPGLFVVTEGDFPHSCHENRRSEGPNLAKRQKRQEAHSDKKRKNDEDCI